MNILGLPWARLESKSDASGWSLGPGSVFSTDVLSLISNVVVLWDWEELSESLLDEIDILLVVLDATGNNEALSWGDVIHDELLEHSGVNVINILLEAESWHTKGVVAVGGSQQKLLLGGEWVIFGQMVVKIVGFGVLGSSNVGGHD